MPKIKYYTTDTYRPAPLPNMSESELVQYELRKAEEQIKEINERKGATIAVIVIILLFILAYWLTAL